MPLGQNGDIVLADSLETQGPCTAPLDAAVDYVVRRPERVLPVYAIAMLPFSVVVVLLIDAITGEQRSRLETYCVYLVAATVWRWIGLTLLQDRVQRDLQGRRGARFWSRICQILMLRCFANGALTWGSILAGLPAFYGLFVGSFAAPLMLDNSDPTAARLKDILSWIHHSVWRLCKMVFVVTFLAGWLMVAILMSQRILVQTVLPSLMGMDTADLAVTISSWAWFLSVLYFVFLVIDLFWSVASVFIYYESQSRRMATDLQLRLQQVGSNLS